MLIQKPHLREVRQAETAPEEIYLGRRRFLGVAGLGAIGLESAGTLS